MILEGIVTTLNADLTTNIAPMGPLVEPQLTSLILRLYRTSQTYQNLKRLGAGVFHVTDDVELLARAAVGAPLDDVALLPAEMVQGQILAGACRAYEFVVEDLDDASERTTIRCRVVQRRSLREFLGFNRAKHAVLEAAILATRIGILPDAQIREEMRRLAVPVEKTAGEQERRAFAFLQAHLASKLGLPGAQVTQ
jgi:hypothetical protein